MENELITIPEENICLRFSLGDQVYVVISNSVDVEENDEIYFAKENLIDGIKIIRNIESDEEYNKVLVEYEKIINDFGEDEENDEL